jgi:hypothetical protein
VIHLVYVSAAVELFTSGQLADLLERSRANNSSIGVTGLLLYKGGNFMQALEGAEEAVLPLFERIVRDPRHHGVIQLIRAPLAERQFGDWAMAFGDLNDPAVAKRPGYSDYLQTPLTAESFAGNEQLALRLLQTFKRDMR